MSPAAEIPLLASGQVKWYSQRVTPKPFVDCMFAALCTPLSFMGYALPETFVGDLRDASGVPRKKPNGDPRGTTTAHTRIALRQLIPDCPIEFGGLPDEVMLARLANGEVCVRVMARNQELPARLRRFVGRRWKGVHAVALGGARRGANGGTEVLWLDPMGLPRPGYTGEFVDYAVVKSALMRTPRGNVRATWGKRDAALSDVPDDQAGSTPAEEEATAMALGDEGRVVLTRARIDEFAEIQRGTPFLHPVSRKVVTHAARSDEFRLAGRSTDDRFLGVWVNTRRLPGARGMTLMLVERRLAGSPFVRSRR